MYSSESVHDRSIDVLSGTDEGPDVLEIVLLDSVDETLETVELDLRLGRVGSEWREIELRCLPVLQLLTSHPTGVRVSLCGDQG